MTRATGTTMSTATSPAAARHRQRLVPHLPRPERHPTSSARRCRTRMHGNVEPDDCLLRIFWKTLQGQQPDPQEGARSAGSPPLSRTATRCSRSSTACEDSMDPDQQKLARAVLETEMLRERQPRQERRRGGHARAARVRQDAAPRSTATVQVLSVRQPLRDIAIEQEKVHAMVNERRQAEARRLNRADYDNAQQAQSRSTSEARRSAGARARRGDDGDDQARAARWTPRLRQRQGSKSIPPGYYDVAQVGLDEAVKEAGDIGRRRAARARPRPRRRPERPRRARRHGQRRAGAQAVARRHRPHALWPPPRVPDAPLLQRRQHRRARRQADARVPRARLRALPGGLVLPAAVRRPRLGQVDARQAHDGAAARGLGAPVGLLVGQGGHERRLRLPLRPAGVLRRCVLPRSTPPGPWPPPLPACARRDHQRLRLAPTRSASSDARI